MPSLIKENLRFFDKNGSDISPVLVDGVWTGSIKIQDTSVGLHEVAHIFIAEDVINTTNVITRTANTTSASKLVTFTSGTTKNVKANMWIEGTNVPSTAFVESVKNPTQIFLTEEATATGSTTLTLHNKRYDLTYPRSSNSKIKVSLESSLNVFYLFDVSYEVDMPVLLKVDDFTFTTDDSSSDVLLFDHRKLNPSEIRKEVAQVNIAATAKVEGAYFNNIIIEEIDADGTITKIANFQISFEAEGEDERFKSLLENFGQSINSDEYIAFRDTDIKEQRINFKDLNVKRKEMLLSFHDIWGYLGSYKGLVNALKYFGYGDLRLKEYWLNVAEGSKNEGKFVTMNVPLSLDYTEKEFKDYKTFIKDLLPRYNGTNTSNNTTAFKKTAKFALFYDLNRDSGEFDEDGLPITEDVFEFTNEEILIKLFSLKNILKEKFLPLNARIIDITGEGVYYDNIGINSWNIPTPTIHVDVEREIDFTATPLNGYLEDLTPTITSTCDISSSYKLADYQYDEVTGYSNCYISDDVDINGNRVVEKHPRFSKKSGLTVTIQNLTNDYIWEELSTSWEDASDKTWEDFRYMDFQTMRWIVRSVNRNIIIYDKKGDIGTLDTIEIILPYLGYYDVTLELTDHFNFPHRQTKRNYIEVRPKEADMVAIFRKHDTFDTWEEIENTEADLALAEMHGNWMDITVNEESTWLEAQDITWEALDWSTYSNQNNLFDYIQDEIINKENEKVGEIIGLNPSKNTIRVRGFNNSLLFNRKQQNAHFMKDRTKSNNIVLDIVGNAGGSVLSFKNTTNNSVHFNSPNVGWIVGNNGKFMYTIDGGSNWEVEPIDTSNNLNYVHFTDNKNGWIVGDFGTVYHYYFVLDSIKKVERVDINTTAKLTSVHFVNRNVGYIGGVGVLFRTLDGGVTWSDIMPSTLSSDTITSLYFTTEAFGVAVTNNGSILKTIDSGSVWSIKTPDFFTQQYEFRSVFYLDSQFGWVIARGTDGMNKVLRTINGGETYIERPFVIGAYSIKFVTPMVGYLCGYNNTIFKTFDGGNTWVIAYYKEGPLLLDVPTLNSIFPASSEIVYAVGTGGSIFKTTVGGFIFNNPSQNIFLNWTSQKQNQQDYIPKGIGADTWITEPYSGTVLQNERAIIAIKHIPTSITWNGLNKITTSWPLGSTQHAINAKHIYFLTPSGKKQYSINSAFLTITNEIEYILDQNVENTSSLTNAFVLEHYSAVYIDSKPKSDSGGLKITWKNIWNNNRDSVLINMVIVLKLEAKDFNCDVLNMEFEGDETIVYLNPQCDVIKYLDSDYSIILKEYDIQEAISKAGSINRNWETFCQDLSWNDMSDKTWNDFEFNGLSYCSYAITKVSRGGTIVVDDKHFFQFDPEESFEIEGEMIDGNGYVNLDSLIELQVGLVGNPEQDYVIGNEYWGLRSSGDGTDLDVGFAVKLVYLGRAKNYRDHLFRILERYETTGDGDEIIVTEDANIAQILDFDGTVLTTDNFGKPSLNLNNQAEIIQISYPYLEKLEVGMPIHGDGIQPGSTILFIDGINPYNPNRIIISKPAKKTGKSLLSCALSELTLDDAVVLLNESDVEGINDFIYSRPYLIDGVTKADYILGVAKDPGVSALHYFEFLYGVESDWEDDPAHTHSYPLGQFKNWTKSEIDGGEPIGENNPPLWSNIYNTYYEFGEWFPVPEKLGEYSEDIESMRALYSQTLDGSFNWQDTMVQKWRAKVSPGTTIFFNSYPSKIVGIKSHYWRLFDQKNSLLFETTNEVLIWNFCDPGFYTIELKVTDIYDNSYLVRRNGFVEVKSPKIINHELPGLGWSPPDIPPNAPTPVSPVPEPFVPPPPVLMVLPPLVMDTGTSVGNVPIPDPLPDPPPPYVDAPSAIYTQDFDVINTWELRTTGQVINPTSSDLLALQMVVAWRNTQIKQKSLTLDKFYVEYYEIIDGNPKMMIKEFTFSLPEFEYNPEGTTTLIILDEENSDSYFLIKDKIERHYIKPTNNSF